MPDNDWVGSAVCAETDPEIFFVQRDHQAKSAKRICGMCPVKDECLDYALRNEIKYGIWGGMTSMERLATIRAERGPDYVFPEDKPLPVIPKQSSDREYRDELIAEHTAKGLTANEIAEKLGITQRTVVRGRARNAYQMGEAA